VRFWTNWKVVAFTEVSDKNWSCDFALAVDVWSRIIELHVKLQGERCVCTRHVCQREDLHTRTGLFSRQLSNMSISSINFSCPSHTEGASQRAQKCSKPLYALHRGFSRRFANIEKVGICHISWWPAPRHKVQRNNAT